MRKCLLLIMSALALVAIGTPAFAIQCVPYAREVSGINLKGDAWQWWNAASGVYDRGRNPKDGAVLVFNRQGSMRHGHVSVVTRVMSNRLVLVDHANWAPARTSGRGEITTAVPVLDVSPRNDWSQVRVWFQPANDFGNRVYRTSGFVYQPRDPRQVRPAAHQVAAKRAAEIFPTGRGHEHSPAKAEIHHAAQAPAAPAAVVLANVKAAEAIMPATPVAATSQPDPAPTAEGLVRVAKHVFRPHSGTHQPATLDNLLFN